jgi:CubicO group peptidase (beta-lactamase class C family)
MRSSMHTVIALVLLGISCACGDGTTGPSSDPNALETITPEEAGFSATKLQEAVDGFEAIGSDAVVVLYDGKIVLSWGQVDRELPCHSIRKPFLSALYGIYVGAGVIDTTRTLADLGIDDIPPGLTDAEKQARVVDLLRSRSGVYHRAAYETPTHEAERPERGSHPPNTFFYYNNWDFNTAGVIFEQETGKSIFYAFQEDIAEPIGMEFWTAADGDYWLETDKSMHPAFIFNMSAMDMARFGLLYLLNGNWREEQIIPADWVEVSTTPYSMLDGGPAGYGMMWLAQPAGAPGPMAGVFGHSGLNVHLLAIFPARNLVIVHRVNTLGPYTVTEEALDPLIEKIVEASQG